RFGDPYTLIGDDPVSRAAIAFGVTGAPETFVVDKNGVIRYKHAGVVTGQVWEEILRPLIEELRRQ
ncbi:MAG: DsbE family thiol:disulfide interchange protein, partial [Proteobacteria bacterium]|nr:DsbE family thiol:disulfide interchange protein [Pseudomonadota bacterium]